MAGRKESTDLFQLIKSLTPEEKGYFRKFAKRHSDKGSSALKLFDEINKQKNYDEKLLKKKFSDLPVRKQQLFNNIMQSLMVSHNEPEGKITYLKVLLEIELLKQKKLYDRALQTINAYLPVARQTGVLLFEEELLRMWNFHLLAKSDGRGRLKQQLEYEERYKEFMLRKQNMDIMTDTTQKIYAIDIINVQDPDNCLNPDDYIDLPFMENPANALTPMAESARCMILGIYYNLKPDNEKYYQMCVQAFENVKRQKERTGKYNEVYIKALRGVAYASIDTRRMTQADKYLQLHKAFRVQGKWMLDEQYLVNNMLQHYIYWRNGKHREGLEFSYSELKRTPYMESSPPRYLFSKTFLEMKLLFELSVGTLKDLQVTASTLHSLLTKEDAPDVDKYIEMIKILAQIKHNNISIVPSLVTNLLRSKPGKRFRERERKFLERLKGINDINKKALLKNLCLEFSNPSTEFYLFGFQNASPILQSLANGKPLQELLAAEQID